MNKTYIFSILLLLGGLLPLEVIAQVKDVSKWNDREVRIVRSSNGNKLDISFSIEPNRNNISSQEVVYIHPVLLSPDGTKQVKLDPIGIVGSGRQKAINRSRVLGNKVDLPVVSKLHSAQTASIDVHYSLDFERWMALSRLIFLEEVYGCASCKKQVGKRDGYSAKIRLFSPDDYRFSFVEPKAVTQKHYEESFESKVNFVVARHELKRNFRNNDQELTRLEDFVNKALKLEGATLNAVYVEGYASPEGDERSNQELSERRAEVLANYVRTKYPEVKRAPLFAVKGFGSDWVGLRRAVESSDLSTKGSVLEALDKNVGHLARRNALMQIEGGKTYQTLLDIFYPPLRRTTFRMGYKVRPFTIEELPRIYSKKPELMSNQELFLLAQQYEKQGKNPLEVYATAYKLYPDDSIAALNYANALLKFNKDEAAKALLILEPLKSDPRSVLPRAIAEQMLGHDDIAEKILMQQQAMLPQ